MVYKLNNPQNAIRLFDGWDETIIWSCLDGTMGEIYGDDTENPQSAMAILGDFCFLRESRQLSLRCLSLTKTKALL